MNATSSFFSFSFNLLLNCNLGEIHWDLIDTQNANVLGTNVTPYNCYNSTKNRPAKEIDTVYIQLSQMHVHSQLLKAGLRKQEIKHCFAKFQELSGVQI